MGGHGCAETMISQGLDGPRPDQRRVEPSQLRNRIRGADDCDLPAVAVAISAGNVIRPCCLSIDQDRHRPFAGQDARVQGESDLPKRVSHGQALT